ncbi:hypothetical protein AAHA92_14414 [Salvia divinorum]|uniref:Uncharacterized protein n=1 Tax=Salvia divinorum TaxID=28513 RepID=A0ABD1HBH0_SALDI
MQTSKQKISKLPDKPQKKSVDKPFVVSKIEDIETGHHVAHDLETTTPVKDQEEQGQVEELLAQGSSVRNSDLRANPFQGGEDDTTTCNGRQGVTPAM